MGLALGVSCEADMTTCALPARLDLTREQSRNARVCASDAAQAAIC